MRIISGTHRGRQIFPDKNFTARPTTDFAKENLFNVLANRISFEQISVLDLFSGTGSISYEFASRGAQEIIAVEANFKHYTFIQKTIKELKFNNIQIYKADAFLACKKLKGRSFDVVFADPPYNLEKLKEIPTAIFENHLVTKEGIVIVEHPEQIDFSSHPYFSEHRQYGSVNFSLFTIK